MHYHNRKSILEDPTSYYLSEAGIEISSEKHGPQGTVPYADVRGLHLSYAPSRVQANRYLADISTPTKKIRLVNELYQGPMNFEDQSDSYRDWILELQRRLIINQAPTICTGGSSALAWWANLGCALTGLLAAIIAGILLFGAIHVIILIKVAIICFYLPRLIRWFKRNRPSRFPLGSIPPHLLPGYAGDSDLPPAIPGSDGDGPPPIPPGQL